MKLAWLTDVHLDFLAPTAADAFLDGVAAARADAILVGGDVADAQHALAWIERLAARSDAPVYFVLGNHDYYRGSIAEVRARARILSDSLPRLRWLPAAGVVELSSTTALIGADGWSDARAGDWDGSTVFLNDYVHIAELVVSDKDERRRRLMALGDECAATLAPIVDDALARFAHVIVLTHVPPFVEACWHEGRISDAHWLPHFTCVAVGEVLRAAMLARPDRRMTVLCGHTHGAGEAHVLPNLVVRTGGARYGAPSLQPLLHVDGRGID